MRNQNGIVVIEFIFSMVVVSGLSVLLFSVTYTLAAIEVTQYVVFSSARAHLAANKDPETQKDAARAKFAQLTTGNSVIAKLYANGWFEVSKSAELDIRGGATSDGRLFSQDLAGGSDLPTRNWFQGVSSVFTSKLMDWKLPLLGTTNPEGDEDFFKTRVNAMLIREPSQKECRDFFEKRRDALSQLPSGKKFYQQNAYIPMEDNGC